MPVIHVDVQEMQRLLGKKVDLKEVAAKLPTIGADLDASDPATWNVEFFPNRPDLYSTEGVARALRAFLGLEPGLRAYKVAKPRETLIIDASVKAVRPFILGAVVSGLAFTDRRIQGLMELQEDLHWGVGARRRKASIGVHDKARLVPPYTYKAIGLDDVAFVPLQGTEPQTPREVLGKHPKGMAYAHLVGERAPLLVDSVGQVLSFPPIINGTLTAVTDATTDVLVDVTGPDERAVTKAMNLVVTHLAEMGGRIEGVTLHEGRKGRASPTLEPERWTLPLARAPERLGIALTAAQQARALERMGHAAKAKGKSLEVLVPAYRADILHEVDLIEDVAIGHGYANFPYEKPRAVTYGRPLDVERAGALAREVMVGLGFTEVMTLTLVSEATELDRLGLTGRPAVRIGNPVTEDSGSMRTTLLGPLMALLEKNVHRDYPQQVFEVGDVVWYMGEGTPVNARMLGWVRAHSKAGFSEAKSVALAVARDLALPLQVGALDPQDPFAGVFVPGRAAILGAADDPVGWFGELSPKTLDAFGLTQPAIAMELRLGAPKAEE